MLTLSHVLFCYDIVCWIMDMNVEFAFNCKVNVECKMIETSQWGHNFP